MPACHDFQGVITGYRASQCIDRNMHTSPGEILNGGDYIRNLNGVYADSSSKPLTTIWADIHVYPEKIIGIPFGFGLDKAFPYISCICFPGPAGFIITDKIYINPITVWPGGIMEAPGPFHTLFIIGCTLPSCMDIQNKW